MLFYCATPWAFRIIILCALPFKKSSKSNSATKVNLVLIHSIYFNLVVRTELKVHSDTYFFCSMADAFFFDFADV